jgi:hypothetical protein
MQARKCSLHVFVSPSEETLHTDGSPVHLREMIFIFRDGNQTADVFDDTSSVDRTPDGTPPFPSDVTYRIGWVDGEDARNSHAQAAHIQQSYDSLFLPAGLSEDQVAQALRNHKFNDSNKEEPKRTETGQNDWKPLPGVRYRRPSEMVMALREVARKGAQAAIATPSPSGPPVVLRELREERVEQESKEPKERRNEGKQIKWRRGGGS